MDLPADRDDAIALLPGLAAAHRHLHTVVWDGPVPAATLERCRLRTAQLLRSPRALAERTPAAGLGDGDLARLPQWPTDPTLDAGTRACLAFAEQFLIDPHGITDAMAHAVTDAYGDAGLVHLTTALGLWENTHRLDLALALLQPAPGA